MSRGAPPTLVASYRILVEQYPEANHREALEAALKGVARRRAGRPRDYTRADLREFFQLMLRRHDLTTVSAAAREYVKSHDRGTGTLDSRVRALLGAIDREAAAIEREPRDRKNLVLIELVWRKRKDGHRRSTDDLKCRFRQYTEKTPQ